jgi:LuxR family maltose regulon positive regulatory protein
LAEPGGILRFFVDLGAPLQPLLLKLAQQGVSPAYIAEICAAFDGSDLRHRNAAQLQQAVTDSKPPSPATLIEGLTKREMDVLQLLDKRTPIGNR